MEAKSSKFKSMVGLQCPHCHKTSMFVNPSLFAIENMGKMKDHCEVCGTDLRHEVGFYFGAAYVSYGLTVALWISLLVALKVLDAIGIIEFGFLTHPVTYLTIGSILTILLFPYLFRVSRSIWAHIFIKSASKKETAKRTA